MRPRAEIKGFLRSEHECRAPVRGAHRAYVSLVPQQQLRRVVEAVVARRQQGEVAVCRALARLAARVEQHSEGAVAVVASRPDARVPTVVLLGTRVRAGLEELGTRVLVPSLRAGPPPPPPREVVSVAGSKHETRRDYLCVALRV